MKKQSILLVAIFALIYASCKKDDKCPYTENTTTAPTAERTQLADWISSNSIPATQHSSGAFYTIDAAGSGDSANVCSVITLKYKGTLFPSGTHFDSTLAGQSITFTLGGLIAGWQRLLPLIKEGGKMKMYIPPALGYGYQDYPSTVNPVIPAGSYLKFEVELLSVQ